MLGPGTVSLAFIISLALRLPPSQGSQLAQAGSWLQQVLAPGLLTEGFQWGWAGLRLPPELVALSLLGRAPGFCSHRGRSVYKPALETAARVCSANLPGFHRVEYAEM